MDRKKQPPDCFRPAHRLDHTGLGGLFFIIFRTSRMVREIGRFGWGFARLRRQGMLRPAKGERASVGDLYGENGLRKGPVSSRGAYAVAGGNGCKSTPLQCPKTCSGHMSHAPGLNFDRILANSYSGWLMASRTSHRRRLSRWIPRCRTCPSSRSITKRKDYGIR